MFQHTAARRRLNQQAWCADESPVFQHTAARRRLKDVAKGWLQKLRVSTHSRPKAAELALMAAANLAASFNTQPPEGG